MYQRRSPNARLRALAALCALLPIPATLAATAPDGTWRFKEDGTVVEFAACGQAACGVVRALLTVRSDEPAPACGMTLVGDLKAQGGGHAGWVADPATGKRYPATLTPDGAGGFGLIVSAMGGLYQETYRLEPLAGNYTACGR